MSPELEKRLDDAAWQAEYDRVQHGLLTSCCVEATKDAFRPLLADLEAKALSARAEAWEEALHAVFMARRSNVAPSDFPNPYAQTQPPDVSKENQGAKS